MIVDVENPSHSTKKVLELKNEYSKVVAYENKMLLKIAHHII